jgi:hypothetical protein
MARIKEQTKNKSQWGADSNMEGFAGAKHAAPRRYRWRGAREGCPAVTHYSVPGSADQLERRGLSSPLGERVKISTPAWVTATVCSNWAESERSRVTAVQPSESTFT